MEDERLFRTLASLVTWRTDTDTDTHASRKRRESSSFIKQKWLTKVWRGVGEQKQSGNESQWCRIHFSVPASVGPSPLLSRLSLTRMMAHVYTHGPHARTYFWSGIRKEHCWSHDDPRESFLARDGKGERGFRLLFSSLSLSHTYTLSLSLSLFSLLHRVLRAVAVRKSLFFRTDDEHAARGSLRTFRRGNRETTDKSSQKRLTIALFLHLDSHNRRLGVRTFNS